MRAGDLLPYLCLQAHESTHTSLATVGMTPRYRGPDYFGALWLIAGVVLLFTVPILGILVLLAWFKVYFGSE